MSSHALEEAETLLGAMSRAEKAVLLKLVVSDLGEDYPGIESQPGVCGGDPCVVRTRIPVWLLVKARQVGLSEAEILRSYPTLRAGDLIEAWAYARSHRKDIQREISANEEK